MGQKEKLEERLKSIPKDFTFDEMTTLLGYYGLTQVKTGKTGGSRVKFANADKSFVIQMHKPHNPNTFKRYMIEQVLVKLEQEGLL